MKLVIIEINDKEIPVFVNDEDTEHFDTIVPQELAVEYFKQNPEMQPRVSRLLTDTLETMGIKMGKRND